MAVPDDLLDALPEEAREPFLVLYERPVVPVAELRAVVQTHLEHATAAVGKNEFVDLDLACALANALLAALDRSLQLDDEHRRAIGAAVGYFAMRDDAEDDLDSILGFEDDARVVNACLQTAGLDDLKVEIE